MATLSISLGSQTRSFTITDAHLSRFIAALKVFYGPKADGTQMTDVEAVNRWTLGVSQGARDITKKVEAEAAKTSAEGGVSDIALV